MKQNRVLLMAVTLALLATGCANSSSSGGNINPAGGDNAVTPITPTTPPVVPPGNGPIQTSGYGATTAFVPVSNQEMNTWVAKYPLNYPTDYKITVDLRDQGGHLYAGYVTISFQDAGQLRSYTLSSGFNLNQDIRYANGNGMYDYAYNMWFMSGGRRVFSGYFADNVGAIVLVIDNVVDLGDAQGGVSLSGRVYYKNFGVTSAPESPYRKCWFITLGPYQCVSQAVSSKNALYPESASGYKLLGTFSGLNRLQAFK
ncbi:MAG: hypothetical protein N2578_09165 [Bdellovibrionaceae bacterium]|nr:hypothetical protein [Pseudobdellovibrionaceae bacterium]